MVGFFSTLTGATFSLPAAAVEPQRCHLLCCMITATELGAEFVASLGLLPVAYGAGSAFARFALPVLDCLHSFL